MKSRKVLIAPLDWGLGHASRCIPLIHYLLSIQWEVVIAGEGLSGALLQQEFPNLRFIPLRGYRITYPKKGKWLIPHVILQIPKIIQAIRYEKKWLQKIQDEEDFDVVISDNRYGLHTKKTTSILITHQLHIISGLGKIADTLLQQILYPIIHQFDECWIPDSENEKNIAGLLSHPTKLPQNVKYIGPISRVKKIESPEQKGILVLLSGLEPQRSQLEEKLLEQLNLIDMPVTLVRGIPRTGTRDEEQGTRETAKPTTQILQPTTLSKLNFMTSQELEQALPNFSIVICRSGYSSLMDMLKVQKKAILIPTPGQTEQEYLAKRLSEMGCFVTQTQENLNLVTALEDCEKTNPSYLLLNFENFKKAFHELGIS